MIVLHSSGISGLLQYRMSIPIQQGLYRDRIAQTRQHVHVPGRDDEPNRLGSWLLAPVSIAIHQDSRQRRAVLAP